MMFPNIQAQDILFCIHALVKSLRSHYEKLDTEDENDTRQVGLKGKEHPLLLTGKLCVFECLELTLVMIWCKDALDFERFHLSIQFR